MANTSDAMVVEAVSFANLSMYTGDTVKIWNSKMNPFLEVQIPGNITPGLTFTLKDVEWEMPSASDGTAFWGYGATSSVRKVRKWEDIKANYQGHIDVQFEYFNYPGLSFNNQIKMRIIIP